MKRTQRQGAGKVGLSFLTFLSLVLIYVISVGGCGSSGGWNNGSTMPLQEVKYEGKTTQAKLTSSNANIFFAEIMGAGSGTNALAKSPAGKESGTGSPPGSLIVRLTDRLQDILLDSTQSPPGQHTLRLSKSISESAPCESGSVGTEGDIADDGTGTLQVNYMACQKEGETINGTSVIEVKKLDTATGMPIEYLISFDAIEFKEATSHYTIGGAFHCYVFLDVGYERVEAELTAVDHLLKRTFRMEDWTMILTYDNLLNPTNYSETFAGRFYDAEEGYVDVLVDSSEAYYYSSNAPLYYSDLSQDFPERGGPIVLSGADGTRARLTILTDLEMVLVDVDADSDTFYEPGDVYTWDGLLSSPPINLPPVVPVVGGVVITPESPHTSDTLHAVAGALDIDRDPLTYTYEWFRNGELIAGHTEDNLPPGNFAKDDVISVRATIFDGTNSVTVESDPVTIL